MYFIVAAPESQRRMFAQSTDVVIGLFSHIPKEFLVARIGSASKSEILPDENPVRIRQLIETFVLVYTASPYAQHIHIRFRDRAEKLLPILLRACGQHHGAGDIVGSLHV